MAEKDITEKILEDYPDVFADIVNGLLFNGETVIKPEELEDTKLRSAYRAEGGLHELERGVAKRWKKNGIRIACVGFENQTTPDSRMVLRVYGYDGAEYRAQCLEVNKDELPYAVVTLVLYFGYEHRWTAPRTLYEAVNVPEEFKPYVPDMKINVFEIAWLSDEQVSRFKSDFRIVADYFIQKRKNGQYKATKDAIKHVNAVLQLLKVMEKDDRFDLVSKNGGKEGGIRNMCDVIDRYLKEGEEKGEAKTICALYESGMKPEEIATRLKKDLGFIQTTIQRGTVA